MTDTVGDRIRERRKFLEMTQKELANKVMLTEFNISKYERNYSSPDLETVKRLSEALGCSVDYLVGKVDVPTAYHHEYNDAEVGKVELDYPYRLTPDEVKEMVETLKKYRFDIDALIKDIREKENKEK